MSVGEMIESTSDALSILKRDGEMVNAYFSRLRERCPEAPARLMESIEYSLMAGGKRLRPSLVLQCFNACSGKSATSALASAAAMELIHTFSLVHDDLPAM